MDKVFNELKKLLPNLNIKETLVITGKYFQSGIDSKKIKSFIKKM